MQIAKIANRLNARVLTTNPHTGLEVKFAFCSDLMSDVLTRDYEHTVLFKRVMIAL